MSDTYDVMVIGSGAGGGTPVHQPARKLYGADTSFFPSIGAVNQALTAIAHVA